MTEECGGVCYVVGVWDVCGGIGSVEVWVSLVHGVLCEDVLDLVFV